MENNPQPRELMEQLEKNSRRQLTLARLQCFFTAAIAVCCLLLLSVVWGVIPQVTELAGQLQQLAVQLQQLAVQVQDLGAQAQVVLTNLETVTAELAQADLAAMVGNVDELVVSSQEGLSQALEKINSMDIEALNQAIDTLSDVIDPLAKFFKVFG